MKLNKKIYAILRKHNEGELIESNCHMCGSSYCGATKNALQEIYDAGFKAGNRKR